MATVGNENLAKTSNVFICEACDYITERKSNYDGHLLTSKHKMATGSHICQPISSNIYECEKCNKTYKDRTGLWKHKKKCNVNNLDETKVIDSDTKTSEIQELKEIMKYLMKENSEMKNMMMKVIENGVGNNCHNTTNTNSHNKAFNLNFLFN